MRNKRMIPVVVVIAVAVVALVIIILLIGKGKHSDGNSTEAETESQTEAVDAGTSQPYSEADSEAVTTPQTEAVTEAPTEPSETDEVVVLHDLVLDLAIHDALGKSYGEKLYASDLLSIKKLMIHTGYSTGVWELAFGASRNVMNIDLFEIRYLENLEELVIENSLSDQVYGFDGLKECKNLKSLSMYYELECSTGAYDVRHGENELMEVIASCSKLETLDLHATQPPVVQDRILAINPNIDIRQYGDYKDYGITTSSSGLDWIRYTYSDGDIDPEYREAVDMFYDGKMHVYKCEGLSEEDEAYLKAHPYVNALWIVGEETDISDISDITQITSLTVSGRTAKGQVQPIVVKNADLLKNMKNLVSLSLLATELDSAPSFIEELPNLQKLELYDLSFIDPKDEEAAGNFMAETQCFSKVRYLGIDRVLLLGNTSDIEVFLKNCDKLKGLYALTLYDAGFYGSITNNIVSRLSDVRYLKLENNGPECFRVSYCNDLKHLRFLYARALNISTEVGWDEFHGLPELYYVNVYSADAFDHLENCDNIRILQNPMYVSALNKNFENESFRTADFSELAKLPYLSYFSYGLGKADYAKSDSRYYLNGLKAMDEKNVVQDFSRNKYNADRAEVWKNTEAMLK